LDAGKNQSEMQLQGKIDMVSLLEKCLASRISVWLVK
jgi:hypothetical protein